MGLLAWTSIVPDLRDATGMQHADPVVHQQPLVVIRQTAGDPSILDLSAHLLSIASKGT